MVGGDSQRRLHRALSTLLVVALIGVFVGVGATLWLRLDPTQKPNLPTVTTYQPFLDDYVVYWSAGRMALESEASGLYNQAAIRYVQASATGQPSWQVADLPFFNPPFIAAMLAPFALLPIKTSAMLFMALSLGTLALTLRYLLRGLPKLEAGLWTLGILSSMPFYYTMLHGQFSFLLLALFTGVYVLLRRRSDAAAGALLALLLMKPQLLLLPLVILVVDKRFVALRGFAVAAAALGLCSLLVAGLSGSFAYVRLMADATGWHNQNGIAIYAMFGWNAFFTDLLHNTAFSLVTVLSLGAALGTIGFCAAAWRSTSQWRDEASFDLRYAVLMLGTLLISPHLYGQDLIIAVLPALLLYRSVRDPKMKLAMTGTFVLAWGLMYQHFTLLNATHLNFVTLMMFGLLLSGALRLRVLDRVIALVASVCQAHLENAPVYDEAS